MDSETSRLRDRVQEVGGRLEDRLEGWLDEPPWEESDAVRPRSTVEGPDPLEDWPEEAHEPPAPGRPGRSRRRSAAAPADEDDPWI